MSNNNNYGETNIRFQNENRNIFHFGIFKVSIDSDESFPSIENIYSKTFINIHKCLKKIGPSIASSVIISSFLFALLRNKDITPVFVVMIPSIVATVPNLLTMILYCNDQSRSLIQWSYEFTKFSLGTCIFGTILFAIDCKNRQYPFFGYNK